MQTTTDSSSAPFSFASSTPFAFPLEASASNQHHPKVELLGSSPAPIDSLQQEAYSDLLFPAAFMQTAAYAHWCDLGLKHQLTSHLEIICFLMKCYDNLYATCLVCSSPLTLSCLKCLSQCQTANQSMPWGHVTSAWTAAQQVQDVEQRSSSVLQASSRADPQDNLQPQPRKYHQHHQKSFYSSDIDLAPAPTSEEPKHTPPTTQSKQPSSPWKDNSDEEQQDVLQCGYTSGETTQHSTTELQHSDHSVLLAPDTNTDLKRNSPAPVERNSEATFSGQVVGSAKPLSVTETREGCTLPLSFRRDQDDIDSDTLLIKCIRNSRNKLEKIARGSHTHTTAKEKRLRVSCVRKKVANLLDKEAAKHRGKRKANQTANGLRKQGANGKNKRAARILNKRLANQRSKHQTEETKNDIAVDSNDAVLKNMEVKKTSENSSLYCSQCDKTFSCHKTLRRHWQTSRAHGQRSAQKRYSRPYRPNRQLEELYWQRDVELLGDLLRCKLCQRMLTNREDWRRHHREHRVRKTLCPVCGAKVENLRIHLLYHRSEKPHKCPYCPASFVLKHKLRDHVFTHTQEKNFCCEICGKSFRVKASLVRHSLVHSNNKPFRCEQCGDSFARNRGLKDHMRVHTGEKPYACGVCGRKFASTGNLAAHRRKVHRLEPMVGGGTKKLILID